MVPYTLVSASRREQVRAGVFNNLCMIYWILIKRERVIQVFH